MEFHINPEERFDNDPLHLSQIGQANQVEQSTMEISKLSLQDNEELNSYPPAPPTPTYGLTHQVNPPSPYQEEQFSPRYSPAPPSPMDDKGDDESEDYLDPRFLNLKSPSKTQNSDSSKEDLDCVIVKEITKTEDERTMEKFKVIFNYLAMKVGVVEDPNPDDWKVIRTPLWVDARNRIFQRRTRYAPAPPSKRSAKRLFLNRLPSPKIITNLAVFNVRVADFVKKNLLEIYNLVRSDCHATYYKKLVLTIYSALYASYSRSTQWRHPWSLATTSLQPGNGNKSRAAIEKRQRRINEEVARQLSGIWPRLSGGRCTAQPRQDAENVDDNTYYQLAFNSLGHGASTSKL